MKPTVYVETSVISYFAARPSRDVVVAAYQEVTREWWRGAPSRFHLVASALVVSEAQAGDADAARARLEALESLVLLDATSEAETLTAQLVNSGAVPSTAAEDAAHIANAAMRSWIEHVCRQMGYAPPVICPPNELLEFDHGDDST